MTTIITDESIQLASGVLGQIQYCVRAYKQVLPEIDEQIVSIRSDLEDENVRISLMFPQEFIPYLDMEHIPTVNDVLVCRVLYHYISQHGYSRSLATVAASFGLPELQNTISTAPDECFSLVMNAVIVILLRSLGLFNDAAKLPPTPQ